MCGFCAKSSKRTAKERQGIYQLLISIICNDMIMKQRPENIAMYI